jgi:hypothetical protein
MQALNVSNLDWFPYFREYNERDCLLKVSLPFSLHFLFLSYFSFI